MIYRVEVIKEKPYKSRLHLLYNPTDQLTVKLRFQWIWIWMICLTPKVTVGVSLRTEWQLGLLISDVEEIKRPDARWIQLI
jgi:hypothetical protein